MSLTDQQVQARRSFIGGSDAPAIAGVNPPGWAQPIDIYLEKRGEAPPRPPSNRMQALGSLMEGLVCQLFTEATGVRLRRPSQPVRSRLYPWAGGNLDRWASDGLVYEGKWGERRDEWGQSLPVGTPENPTLILEPHHEGYTAPVIPLRYALQVQHYLAASDRPAAYVAVLLGYADFRWYVLHRNDELIAGLMALEEEFWHRHVLAGVPPEPDGSEGYGRLLRRLYAASDDIELVATPEQQAMAERLHAALRAERAAARERAAVEQALQLSMGPAAKLVFPGGQITWRTNRPGLRVDWEALATRLLQLSYGARDDEAAGEAVAAVTPIAWPSTKKGQAEVVRAAARALELASEQPGARPWKPQFDSDEEGTE